MNEDKVVDLEIESGPRGRYHLGMMILQDAGWKKDKSNPLLYIPPGTYSGEPVTLDTAVFVQMRKDRRTVEGNMLLEALNLSGSAAGEA